MEGLLLGGEEGSGGALSFPGGCSNTDGADWLRPRVKRSISDCMWSSRESTAVGPWLWVELDLERRLRTLLFLDGGREFDVLCSERAGELTRALRVSERERRRGKREGLDSLTSAGSSKNI